MNLDYHNKELVRIALAEDIGSGDVTSLTLIPASMKGTAIIVAKQPLVVCGMLVAQYLCELLHPEIKLDWQINDGDYANSGDTIASLSGPYQPILALERTLLNFLQHLSAISSKSRRLSEMAKPHQVKILDTRKTTPGWRTLEKYAVRIGGCFNHRHGLFDQVLIKDTHVDAFPGTLTETVEITRQKNDSAIKIEIEVRNMDELAAALKGRPDIVMLDNMSPEQVKSAVKFVRSSELGKSVLIELSGGMNETNISPYFACGADAISVGELTHSIKAVDIGMYYQPEHTQ
ncbi:MAG: carboxylating nicotinate-nucleotide diphosphorylase [bacterium]|nr:carboxylating nicotinate-nucleotide diphosphorylase [bacterium]